MACFVQNPQRVTPPQEQGCGQSGQRGPRRAHRCNRYYDRDARYPHSGMLAQRYREKFSRKNKASEYDRPHHEARLERQAIPVAPGGSENHGERRQTPYVGLEVSLAQLLWHPALTSALDPTPYCCTGRESSTRSGFFGIALTRRPSSSSTSLRFACRRHTD